MLNVETFEAIRSAVKQELDSLGLGIRDPKRLAFIERRIADLLPRMNEGECALRIFCFTIHILLTHEQTGELSSAQTKQHYEMALTILQKLTSQKRKSELMPLFGLVDSIMSQIHRKMGEHVTAGLYQILAGDALAKPGQRLFSSSYQHFCLANRYFRLGHAEEAAKLYDQALEAGLAPQLSFQAQLLKGILCRVTAQHTQAEMIHKELLSQDLSEEEKCEVTWEQASQRAVQTGDWHEMRSLTMPRKAHGAKRFSAEMVMYAIALSKTLPKNLPAVYNLREPAGEQRQGDVSFFRAAHAVQGLTDQAVPRRVRIRSFIKANEDLLRVVTIDRELLLWLAAAHAARSEKMTELSSFCLNSYETMCNRLTKGKSNNIFRAS